MDYLRSNVLRRGQSSDAQTQDLEQQGQPEMGEQSGSHARRFPVGRPSLPTLFTNRLRTGGQSQSAGDGRAEDDSPKTPRPDPGFPNTSSTHLRVPNLTRTEEYSRPTSGRTETPSAPTSQSHPPPTQTERLPIVSEPRPSYTRSSHRDVDTGRSQPRGADPGETRLVDQVDRTRRNRSRRQRQHARPEKFLFCFPWVKSRRIRSQILRCFVSGLFLMLMLSIYLVLSISKRVYSNEFTVLLIVIILFSTIFFCHGLIRICMLIIKPPNEDEEQAHLPRLMEPGGYAVPRRPIHVILAQDEEAAGMDNVANKLEPPAYGLWRESVRVDPDRLYWQRNDQPPTEANEERYSRPGTARPPSYASEDGVSYVVEARPRSIAPLSDVPLPPHPFETRPPSVTDRP
ncbi:hypothetical protein F4813DRAFT_161497 [Daldinia decipiens]|uniref:uncharacterized protein n=1 Tax=Daldinia decipiens TaxID=326647 RepID=UPI0020C52B08|nr:uncharacterized protein F4813DRAFT_161497 [Daldinia decipiens]KAI1655519.1 hypothetical protein F4813DRAFT_161497 [Daldinia decipiens]